VDCEAHNVIAHRPPEHANGASAATADLLQRLVDFYVALENFGQKLRQINAPLLGFSGEYSHTLRSIEAGVRTFASAGM
jgi:hypothetical protein